jgi:hypothetical protein
VLVAMARREHRRDPGVQREGNDVTQAAFQSPTAHAMRTHGDRRLGYVASVTTGAPPTHPAQLSDGGGTDVGGVACRESSDPRHRHRDKLREPTDPSRWRRRSWRDGIDATSTAEDSRRRVDATTSPGTP